MNQLDWLKKIDPALRKPLLYFALSLILFLFVGLPLKKGVSHKRGLINMQRQQTLRVVQAEQALSDEKSAKPSDAISLVTLLEQLAMKLDLQKKVLRIAPFPSGVDFEMTGIVLEEVTALLSELEQNVGVGQLTFIKLMPETGNASSFYLHAKLEKN